MFVLACLGWRDIVTDPFLGLGGHALSRSAQHGQYAEIGMDAVGTRVRLSHRRGVGRAQENQKCFDGGSVLIDGGEKP